MSNTVFRCSSMSWCEIVVELLKVSSVSWGEWLCFCLPLVFRISYRYYLRSNEGVVKSEVCALAMGSCREAFSVSYYWTEYKQEAIYSTWGAPNKTNKTPLDDATPGGYMHPVELFYAHWQQFACSHSDMANYETAPHTHLGCAKKPPSTVMPIYIFRSDSALGSRNCLQSRCHRAGRKTRKKL